MKKVKEGDIFELRVRPTIIPTATTTKVEKKKAQFPSRSQPVCTLLQDTLHCSGSRTRPKFKSRGADSASAAYRRLIKAAVQTEEAGLTYCFCLLCTQPPPPPPQSLPIRSSGSNCQPVHHHQPQLRKFAFLISLLLLCLSSTLRKMLSK